MTRQQLWDEIARDYVNQLNPGGQAVDFYIINRIQNHIDEADKVNTILDVGCGNGIVTSIAKSMLKQKNGKKIKYVGVDISKEMIDLAEQKFGNKEDFSFYHIKDKFNNIPDEIMDLAMAHWVYITCDSLDTIRKSFEEVHRVLKPDGKLYFSAHNLDKDAIGTPLSTYAVGERGKSYKTEDTIMVAFYEKDQRPEAKDLGEWYKGNNPEGTLIFPDSTFYPKDYERLASEIGFNVSYEKVWLTQKEIDITKRIFGERAPDFEIESKVSPGLMFVLQKV